MKKIAFLLIDGFALLSTASALEPLRAANLFSATPLYDITLLSQSGSLSRSSVGGLFETRSYRDAPSDLDLVFVVAGGDPARISDPALFAWLRKLDRDGVALGGISGGAVILAKAGLLENRRFTVHWHHYGDFDRLPGLWLLERRLFVIDRDRYTCAGGASALDMMHAILARDHGTGFAQRISDWFIQTEIRAAEEPQQASIAARYGAVPSAVAAALELMESHIADPLDQGHIAHLIGMSSRQLQRLFGESLNRSVMQAYRHIRLETAKSLIKSTRISLTEISLMTGFSSQTHFSDSFRKTFGVAPSSLRKTTRAN